MKIFEQHGQILGVCNTCALRVLQTDPTHQRVAIGQPEEAKSGSSCAECGREFKPDELVRIVKIL